MILNYNGRAYLQQFLPSVLQHSPDYTRVVVADNGSTDDSVALLQANFPQVEVLELAENHGFAEGYNQALARLTESEFSILLNSDVEVSEGWLPPLVNPMTDQPDIAACQAKILSFDEKDRFEYAGGAGGWIDNLGYPFCRGRVFQHTETDRGQYDQAGEIFWSSGAAMAIRTRLFLDAGGFDGDYFAHLEEIDLCWRLKRAGYKIMAQPASVVFHKGGGTLNYNTPGKAYLNFRNSLYTLVKNESFGRLSWLLPARLILDGVAAGLFLTEGKLDHIWAIIRAHWTFFPRFFYWWKKRRETRETVEDIRVKTDPNHAGRYWGSIVWDFYLRKKRIFSRIVTDPEP